MVYEFVVHTTLTEVTFALPIVPEPLVTTQVCEGPEGWLDTVTAYVTPLATVCEKENVPLDVSVRLLPPLFCSTT